MTHAPRARRHAPGASKKDERGFALLFVFLMAAIIGLYLYMQLPRVAFESERDKEQLLIDRGEQYKRAIQLYVLAVKKYPQKIEDLENTNDKRYLRQRYIDPFTGKDEWRLIHVNAAGILTDSLVQKPPATPDGSTPGANSGQPGQQNGQSGSNSFFASATGQGTTQATNANGPTGATGPPDPNDVNQAVRLRPSDVVGNAYTTPVNGDPNDPSTWAPITLAPANNGANGTAPTGQPPSGAVGFNGGLPGQTTGQNGQPGGTPGFPLPGQPGFNPAQNQFKVDANGNLVPVQPPQPGVANPNGVNPNGGINPNGGLNPNGGIQNAGAPQQPAAGMGGPGMNPFGNSQAAQNVATQAINNMLTNPNPQAGAGLGTSQGMTTGGIAGVASMYKGTSIKIYATRQKYQEWEFIFSLNNQQNGQNTNANPLGNNQQNPQNGQNGQNSTSPFGSTVGSTTTTTSGTGTPPGTGNQ